MQPVYVALGDSMSIDAYAGGAGRGAASLLHRNRDGDFPDWAGRDLQGLGYAVQNLTRDGATTVGVLQSQLSQIRARPNLITLSMGGNDLMGAYGDTAAARGVVTQVAERAERILDTLRVMAGSEAAIVVTTVYDPSDGTGVLPGGGLPAWPDGSGLLAELNTVLTAAAGRHGALVADVHAHFQGHGAAAGDPAQPDPRPVNRQLWYCGVIEPNAWGAHEIRTVWWRTLREATAGQTQAG
ncbi:GDSL-type esterase/lipase family protein [Actinoplanes sp. NBC_00393]|uniref:SGNH/GDSL hydrolase family protein n=1 Tax=Actinoplanes sp. NBC_00393 TaxID=2975953 RepID=UPI002E21CB6A